MKKIIKNSILILVMLATMFTITGCGSTVQNEADNTLSNEENKVIEYKAEVIPVDYNHDFAGKAENKKVITNYDELKNYCRNLNSDKVYIDDGAYIGTTAYIPEELSKYDEEFFKNKSLALIYICCTSTAETVKVNYAKKENNKVIVEHDIDCAEIGACVMSAELISVEVDKDINEIEIVFTK